MVSRFGKVSEELIRKCFPNLSRKDREEFVNRPAEVDFLISNRHASWQPDKAEIARGEPEVFVMRSRFGLALGGSYGFQAEWGMKRGCVLT